MKQDRVSLKNLAAQIDDPRMAALIDSPLRHRIIIWLSVAIVGGFVALAAIAQLEEITRGVGKVIPSSHLQIVQNLEGGIIKSIAIREGEHVAQGQSLLEIDDTRFRSDLREQETQTLALQAQVLRLKQEIKALEIDKQEEQSWKDSIRIIEQPVIFPANLQEHAPDVVQLETDGFHTRIAGLRSILSVAATRIEQQEQELVEINNRMRRAGQSYALVQQEINMTAPLAKDGIVPPVELLKLQRQANDLLAEKEAAELMLPKAQAALREAIAKRRDDAQKWLTESQQKLSEIDAQFQRLSEAQVGMQDKVQRTQVVSPVAGTVQKIHINTVGGVVQPGSPLVEIVPSDDRLLIEARVLPKDIAFIRRGLKAIVRLSAYDFAIYGSLQGTVEYISADTVADEDGNSFYVVRIRTVENTLHGRSDLQIVPGMQATVDIITGQKSLLTYLLKPILRAREIALTEK
ncbi:HlyD family type I secretion periplasmic adaptor subunit [Plesiomonas shigelloides]|uniref:HlyD family type I secretion periplasmic adaptor subunit n=1 Tax=Plesiomonas shigelloides TaxID=703 RepID=UPI001261E4AA|nr:HlyD family type I secretion periplasmic adaptor subunit [Plesiomonas shigelloides]KAB7703480.1 HlyD family type I secretion periplasmic adaptor subunit [Plesiomonas shigelloides]